MSENRIKMEGESWCVISRLKNNHNVGGACMKQEILNACSNRAGSDQGHSLSW